MGNYHSIISQAAKDSQSGKPDTDCGTACKAAAGDAPPQPVPPPPPTKYNTQKGKQQNKDVYDSTLGNQRFQSQSGLHY